ncbi:shikimate kinase [Nakamurella flavida]|uniref:Shikimate kinase n=1 Tax=Nakamurella flavida TaxID=363630 RepID=A0A938YFY2_9ACTN|nr:shikimate kinase [Nakamurella flavida]MBM9476960.1 shikimate kinase [Nakamurella flavida]MDP9779905.1 shikimate kinase [Nakamurella flavida]
MGPTDPTTTDPITADPVTADPVTTGPLVVLVGPPGSGKSSVGAALARLTGTPLRDTDTDIETRAGTTIAEIFTGRGEPAFRELEEQAVADALAEHPGVLALGGGAVLSARTRARLAGHPVAYLSVSATTGVQRVGLASHRPLMVGVNPRATYRALLADRVPLYREVARWEFATDTESVADLARAVADAVALPATPTPAEGQHR